MDNCRLVLDYGRHTRQKCRNLTKCTNVLKPKNVYLLLTITCLLGWAWLLHSFIFQKYDVGVNVCLSKHITSIPCPSCGTTRSVMALFQEDVFKAMYWNPIGIVASCVLVLVPFLLLYDWIFKKKTIYKVYLRAEETLSKPLFYIPLCVLVLLNWFWNIYKGV